MVGSSCPVVIVGMLSVLGRQSFHVQLRPHKVVNLLILYELVSNGRNRLHLRLSPDNIINVKFFYLFVLRVFHLTNAVDMILGSHTYMIHAKFFP